MGEEETPSAAEPEATEPAAEPAPEAEPAAEDAAPETPAPAADADAAAGADADAGAGAGAGDDADAASAAPPTAPDSPAPVTTGDGTPAEVGTPADAATTDADTPADGATPADGSPSKDANTDADDESDGDGDGDEEGSPAKDSEGGGVGDGDGDDDDGGDADGERANGADGGRDADGTQSDNSDAELADFYRRDGAAAHDIEGFNDDFVAQGQSDSDEDEYAAEMVKLAKETEVALASLESEKKGGQGKKDDGPDEGELLEEEILRVQDEVFKLDRVNSELEKKAAQVVKRAPGAAGSGASASASGGASDAGSDAGPGKKKPAGAKPAGDDPRSDQKTEQRYHAALTRWESSRDELNRVEAHYDDAIARAEAYLEARETRARDVRDAFAAFKLEVAKAAENSRTGQPLAEATIKKLVAAEKEKEAILDRERLKNVVLRHALERLERAIRAKERLADGLHLIDFEQLKIENHGLHEKIEERDEELLKLRKKTTTTVQVLTHSKEKLQFVARENEALAADMARLEEEGATKKDTLTRLKNERDAFRAENEKMKEGTATISDPMLIADYELQLDVIASCKKRVIDAQKRIKALKETAETPRRRPGSTAKATA